MLDTEVCACAQHVVLPGQSINQSTKIEMASRLVPLLLGEGVMNDNKEGNSKKVKKVKRVKPSSELTENFKPLKQGPAL